ncbi:MAG: hypothetical protein GIW95_10725 [Candidatus Eremiobacteraeota bacterium]|nr:hypothetical protein [Candidatus Eremiobacteraeota bacterium]
MSISDNYDKLNGDISTVRAIPSSLAGLLADLELDQPSIVSLEDIERLASARHILTPPREIARRLRGQGWLLPLRTRGFYEFAPGSRAGRFRSGDSFTELRATLRRKNFPIALAHESAAWVRGLSQHQPDQPIIAVSKGTDVPQALAEYRIVRQTAKLPHDQISDLPVWPLESLLVLMAARPTLYRDWANVNEWLPRAVRKARLPELLIELESMSAATWVRLAYLFDRSGNSAIAGHLMHQKPNASGPVYFGPDRRHGIRDANFNVIDSLLCRADW